MSPWTSRVNGSLDRYRERPSCEEIITVYFRYYSWRRTHRTSYWAARNERYSPCPRVWIDVCAFYVSFSHEVLIYRLICS